MVFCSKLLLFYHSNKAIISIKHAPYFRLLLLSNNDSKNEINQDGQPKRKASGSKANEKGEKNGDRIVVAKLFKIIQNEVNNIIFIKISLIKNTTIRLIHDFIKNSKLKVIFWTKSK